MFLQQLINGITIGSTYALVAIGYSMVFGVLELINFANGAVYMLGGYLTLMLYRPGWKFRTILCPGDFADRGHRVLH